MHIQHYGHNTWFLCTSIIIFQQCSLLRLLKKHVINRIDEVSQQLKPTCVHFFMTRAIIGDTGNSKNNNNRKKTTPNLFQVMNAHESLSSFVLDEV